MAKRLSSEDVSDPANIGVSMTPSVSLALNVMAVMKEAYGALPPPFWGISRAADLLAPRGFKVRYGDSMEAYYRIKDTGAFPIVSIDLNVDQKVELPEGVRSVVCGFMYAQPIELPPSVIQLDLGVLFNHPISLPSALEEVDFGVFYDQPISSWPQSLKTLMFDPFEGTFSQPLDCLPSSLRKLVLSRSFNHLIVLPEGLESIEFGFSFNQPIVLPKSLKRLEFSERGRFNQQLILPEGLQSVTFPEMFSHPVILPSSLREASFGVRYQHRSSLKEREGLFLTFRHPISCNW